MRRRTLLIALVLGLIPFGVPHLGATATLGPMEYVAVDDGTEIAVRAFFPAGFDKTKRYPTLVTMEGYGGAGDPNDGTFIGNTDYVVLAISVRGTGCSAGQLSLFSDRSSKDGAWIIDRWVPKQSWSNGDVGIYGHSYAGLTGFLVAAQHPTHLKAIAVSGLIDDFYRAILFPGGVPNPGFPLLWGGLLRPISEHVGNVDELQADPHCQQNYLDHQGADALNVEGLAEIYTNREATAGSWAIQRSLINHIKGIRAPIQLGQQYQDEQTGPRGGHILWKHIPRGIPKRIAISTGKHNPNDPKQTKRDWFDCWLRGHGSTSFTTRLGHSCADILDPNKRVLLYFESQSASRWTPVYAKDWPAPATDWQRYYFGANGKLTRSTAGIDGSVQYLSTGTGRFLTGDLGDALGAHEGPFLAPVGYASGLPDTARYQLTFPAGTTNVIAGPMTATVWATASSADVDFWVELLDLNTANGATSFIQRGLLRASFREFSYNRSDKTAGGDVYRPYHPFVSGSFLTPMQPYQYQIEVFPAGHVFRPGHALVLQVHAPPINDPISTYLYEPNQPSVVTIMQDSKHRTSILLPFLHNLTAANMAPAAPACGQIIGEVCVVQPQ
jgi:putative CocE/NonD family hydrolase